MKDLFVPKSKQLMGMRPGGSYMVLLYIDEQTGRVAATEKFDWYLDNSWWWQPLRERYAGDRLGVLPETKQAVG